MAQNGSQNGSMLIVAGKSLVRNWENTFSGVWSLWEDSLLGNKIVCGGVLFARIYCEDLADQP